MDWSRGTVIGEGSTATVSLATSLQSGNVFAVKSAELSRSGFLQREAKILSSISSPFVIGYRGSDITRECNKVMYNLFLEYMRRGTLSDAIRSRGGRLEERTIGYYICQILQGLEYLHSRGLVHCDIKATNILIGHDGSAKIADFGCSKQVDPEDATMPSTIGGTPMFMAPEVVRGQTQGFASDIWALGCTLVEMASGGPPWPINENDSISLIYQIGYSCELPEFPDWLSEKAKDFLDKCLNRDPKERWTTSQLIKHPFLAELDCDHHTIAKQVQESSSSSNSPTSVLDQGFWVWNSDVELPSLDLETMVHTGNNDHQSCAAGERIRRLSCCSNRSLRDLDDNWITVREQCDVGAS